MRNSVPNGEGWRKGDRIGSTKDAVDYASRRCELTKHSEMGIKGCGFFSRHRNNLDNNAADITEVKRACEENSKVVAERTGVNNSSTLKDNVKNLCPVSPKFTPPTSPMDFVSATEHLKGRSKSNKKRGAIMMKISKPLSISSTPTIARHARLKKSGASNNKQGFWKGILPLPVKSTQGRKRPNNPFKEVGLAIGRDISAGMRRSRNQMYTSSSSGTRSPNSRRVKRLRITIPKPKGVITRTKVPDSYGLTNRPLVRRDGGCYGGQNYAVSFRRGRRRNMEDFHSAVPEMIPGRAVGFFGVFDGHGGGRCADYSAKNLPKIVSQRIDKTPRSLFQGAFSKLDDEFLSIANSNRWNDGSTAVAALLRDCTLTVANAGDSKAVLSSGGQAVVMSRDHNPGCKEEKHRIEKKGGRVVFLRTWRVEATLAVSRAIGNRSLKAYVTSEPDVTTKTLKKGDDFLVLGTDGLWDFIKPQEAISIASEFLESESARLQEAAKRLTDLAFDRGSLDNITALVIDLRPYQPRQLDSNIATLTISGKNPLSKREKA
mmetsp:Transcript_44930/g.74940  ORF Transcript_44930/g.74940 Transcript_44930/m.74940 type:complete len:545 (+) Transcript_44930:65-1699(+)